MIRRDNAVEDDRVGQEKRRNPMSLQLYSIYTILNLLSNSSVPYATEYLGKFLYSGRSSVAPKGHSICMVPVYLLGEVECDCL